MTNDNDNEVRRRLKLLELWLESTPERRELRKIPLAIVELALSCEETDRFRWLAEAEEIERLEHAERIRREQAGYTADEM